MKVILFNILFLLNILAFSLHAEEDETDVKHLISLSLEELMDIKIITAKRNQ